MKIFYKTAAILLVLVITLSFFGCKNNQEPKKPITSPTDTVVETTEPAEQKETETPTESSEDDIHDMEGDQYKNIGIVIDKLDNGENVLYSPLSLNFALGLISEGASDSVKKDFENYFGLSFDEYNNFYKDYITNADNTIEIANAFFIKKGNTLNKDFAKAIAEDYQAEYEALKFDKAFVEKANKWCSDKTHGMIKSILDKEPNADAVALNALYFNGKWKETYNKKDIRETTFKLTDNETKEVSGLYSTENYYLENDKAKGFMKYYDGNRYAFVGILPNDEDASFKFSDLDIKSLLDSKEELKVNVMIPKFTFDNKNDLESLVGSLGLESILKTNAFDKIINEAPMSVTKIIQKTKIELDENGTKAAAVTEIEMLKNAVAKIDETKQVYLDRPFAFLIYDTEKDVVLFAGKVVNP